MAFPSLQSSVLRFGIPTLDRLLGAPRDPEAKPDSKPTRGIGLRSIRDYSGSDRSAADALDTISVCIIGSDGVGKSMLAMHLCSTYRAETTNKRRSNPDKNDPPLIPMILYASTDLTHGRANASWRSFALDLPLCRIRDPFDAVDNRTRYCEVPDPDKHPRIELKEYVPLAKQLPAESTGDVAFLDLATNTTGDDWAYLNRVVASLQHPPKNHPKHLLVVDAVEGLEVLVGETDAYGQHRDRRSRVTQLIRTAAERCHIVFLVEQQEGGRKTPEEFIADAVIRLSSIDEGGYSRRIVSVEKVRGQTHVRGQHDLALRSGKGSTTGKYINPDDPRVPHPSARQSSPELLKLAPHEAFTSHTIPISTYCQSYAYVFHSLHLISREVMNDVGGPIVDSNHKVVAGFGIEHLDAILRKSDQKVLGTTDQTLCEQGDLRGLPADEPTALIGEDGTFKSKLSKAFLARSQHPERNGENGLAGIPVLLTTKTLERDGLIHRIKQHLLGRQQITVKHAICRRLEIHYMSAAALFHTIRMLIRAAQAAYFHENQTPDGWIKDEAERRKHGWNIRFVIDNWTAIQDAYPQVQNDPLFLPSLLFLLRREGIASLIIANEERGFTKSYRMNLTRRLRDVTSIQMYTWRVAYFGESRVAITVNPPLQSEGAGSVIRELRLFKEHASIHSREWSSRKVGVSPVFELYDGLEAGQLKYVPLRVYLYGVETYSKGKNVLDVPGLTQQRDDRNQGHATAYYQDVKQAIERLLDIDPDGIPVKSNSETSEASASDDHEPAQNDRGAGRSTTTQVMIEPPEHYESLRDFSELQGVARFPYTIVLQVDEYWAKSHSLQLRAQQDYLNARTAEIKTVEKAEPTRIVYLVDDPFQLFQPSSDDVERLRLTRPEEFDVNSNPGKTVGFRRCDTFSTVGYSVSQLLRNQRDSVVKVPYSWDFGFLMLSNRAWTLGSSGTAGKNRKERSRLKDLLGKFQVIGQTSAGVGDSPMSWREFAEFCNSAAGLWNNRNRWKKNSESWIPFDVAPELQETVSSLFLEILVSEIELRPVNRHARLCEFSTGRNSTLQLENVLPPSRHEPEGCWDVGEIIRCFSQEAAAALILLSILLPESRFDDDNTIKPRDADKKAVAVRAWYSAARSIQTSGVGVDSYGPAQLPGTRSVRGDWFLAIARGSRSIQMGERAIDLLNSRRANIVRLQTGIGLPVRNAHNKDSPELWTNLTHDPDSSQKGQRISYAELLELGAAEQPPTSQGLTWLWRSRIKRYDRHARLLRRWLCSMLRQSNYLMGENNSTAEQKLKLYDELADTDADGVRRKIRRVMDRIDGFVGSVGRATMCAEYSSDSSEVSEQQNP